MWFDQLHEDLNLAEIADKNTYLGKLWSCQGQKSQLAFLMSHLGVFFTQL